MKFLLIAIGLMAVPSFATADEYTDQVQAAARRGAENGVEDAMLMQQVMRERQNPCTFQKITGVKLVQLNGQPVKKQPPAIYVNSCEMTQAGFKQP